LRGSACVHTFSTIMCWAACDRLARIATRLGLEDRARSWRSGAARIRRFIDEQCWSDARRSFVASAGGVALDASLLLLADLGFVKPDDPRFVRTVEAIGLGLKRGDALFRYVAPDDFGSPETSFTICTFWYIDALALIGRVEEARALLERILRRRNPLGLLSEDLEFGEGEAWGNFPQTYSHVGLIIAAMRLSRPWRDAV
jgi:GH15 family glucan-1,4-alpha-glucosidase